MAFKRYLPYSPIVLECAKKQENGILLHTAHVLIRFNVTVGTLHPQFAIEFPASREAFNKLVLETAEAACARTVHSSTSTKASSICCEESRRGKCLLHGGRSC